MDPSEAIAVLGKVFLERGLSGGSGRYRRIHPDLLWLVDLELIPRTNRVGITVGVCPGELVAGGFPAKANNCPVIFIPENGGEPFGVERATAWKSLDMSSGLDELTRVEGLITVAAAISSLVVETDSVADLRQMAVSGRLRAALRKDARELLLPAQ